MKFAPRLRFKDQLKSLVYRLLRSEAANGYSYCIKCIKKKKQISDFTFKPEFLIGYDRVLGEWVVFSEYNTYAKIWAMNGYVIKIYTLSEKLWKNIKNLCRQCMNNYFETYIEPRDEDETG